MQDAEPLEQPAAAVRPLRGEQEMNVVRHETVSVQGAAFFAEQSTQLVEEERTVRVLMEAGSAIVPALNSMYGNASKHDPGTSGHSGSTKVRPLR